MINRYIIFYFLFSLIGWIWESIYCTIKNQKWQNRGFLYGPVCPIYGWGSILALVVYDLINSNSIEKLSWWEILLAGFIVSMILEYPTSYILEKLFHARWWDYSDLPLNINGRTSVFTSIGFGLAAILIIEYLLPWANNLYQAMPNFLIISLAYILIGIHSSDLTLTVINLTNFQKHLDILEQNFQDRMTARVDNFYQRQKMFNPKTLRRVVSFRMTETRNKIAEKVISEIERIEEELR